jgi:3-hydroxyisobutyrate dehydrogenase-like beta-hydroxyacid dehydrogenase
VTRQVGVIGLGIMGSAMSANLIESGFEVIGYDVDAGARTRHAAAGGRTVDSVAAVAGATDLIILSLPHAPALAEVAAALAAAGREGLVVAETSTLALADKEAAQAVLAAAGVTLLDCPLSGTGAQARVRQVSVYASGERAAYERFVPVFPGFAAAHYYVGAFGHGSRMKYVANLLVGIHNVAAAEALALAARAGLDGATVYEVIQGGAGTSRMFEVRGPMMLAGDYLPATATVDMFRKDLAIIGDFARAVGAATPLLDVVRGIYDAADAAGYGAEDTAVARRMLESRDG